MPATHSLVVECPLVWLQAQVAVQRGGRQPRWKASRTFPSEPDRDLIVPVRFLRVLYALPNEIYSSWMPGHVPAGYEYFIPHSSLRSYNSQTMQVFLRRLTLSGHRYMAPSRA